MKESILNLIRLGIGHEPKNIPDNIDWKGIYRLAQRHSLLGIVWDGVNVLYDKDLIKAEKQLDPKLKLHWISSVLNSYEKNYVRYKTRIGQLARFYNSNGCKLMVLKGYGLSLNYPKPDHRPCGDIDTWAFGNYKLIDKQISEQLGVKIDSSHHHHTVYQWYEYGVENHYDWVNVHYGHKNAELEKVFKELAMDDGFYTEIDGEKVYLPSPNLHALFLVRHTMLHFASTSVTLRQLLDWGFFVEKNSSKLDWNWLVSVMNTYNMTAFFDYMNDICVSDLGFAETDYPYVKHGLKFKERILSDIITPEFQDYEPEGALAQIVFRWRRRRANAWKREICYGDEGLRSLLVSIKSHLISPKC